MFGLKKKSPKATVPALIEVRSNWSQAYHVLSTAESGIARADHAPDRETKQKYLDTPALCGMEGWAETNSVLPVDKQKIEDSWNNQSQSWYWCKDCAGKVLNG